MNSSEQLQKIKNDKSHRTYVIPMGGCGEFGLNMTLLVYRGEVFVIDCGLMFPEESQLGVDAIIPDVDPVFAQLGKPTAYLITHGHEDHIGALAHIHRRWKAPVYSTAWTKELILDKFSRLNIEAPDHRLVQASDKIQVGGISVDWIGVNHSIPMCCSLHIKAGKTRVFHTGDFKFEDQSLYEKPLQETTLSAFAGVDLLLADSTNAFSRGDSPNEADCRVGLAPIFQEAKGDIFLTTFSSNLWRILSILSLAKQYKRKVHMAGAGMERTIELARKLEMIGVNADVLINASEFKLTKRGERVILCTGCQAEPMSALARIARDEYTGISVRPGDVVVFSSRVIPGSERTLAYLEAKFAKKKIQVCTARTHPGIHVSGHAYQGDLSRLIGAVKPKHLCPIHGTFSQLGAHKKLALELRYQEEQIFEAEDGAILCLDEDGSLSAAGEVEIDWLYVDGFAKVPLRSQNLKQRLKIGELGLVIFSGVFQRSSGNWVGEVFLDAKGIELPGSIDPDKWFLDCKSAALAAIEKSYLLGANDAAAVNEAVRLALRMRYNKVLGKKIVVSASIHVI